MNLLTNSKEVMIIFPYSDFQRWKDKHPMFTTNVPDNQLAYLIFESILKSKINNVNLQKAIDESVKYTSLYQDFWYRNKKQFVTEWIMDAIDIFLPPIESFIKQFSYITYIYTDTVKECDYIKLNICGRIKNYYDEKNIDRIPSADGIAETTCKLLANENSVNR